MPKTFHMNVTFDVKVVIPDADLEAIDKAMEEGRNDPELTKAMSAQFGLHLSGDDQLVHLVRANLRNGIADILSEEYPKEYSFSPAKVTQVIVSRIETHHKAHDPAKMKDQEVTFKYRMGGRRNH